MTFDSLSRIFLKTSLWFILIMWIFFFDIKEVNLSRQVNYDLSPVSVAKVKKVSKVSTNNKIIKVSKIDKRKFLLKLVIASLHHKHYSALNIQDYNKLCSYYPWWCNIIDIDSSFDYQKKVYYTALTIYLASFVNKYLPSLKKELFYIKIQPEKLWRRWYAGHHSIILNVKKWMWYDQFFQVLTHEMGHIVDLWVLVWHSHFKSKNFTEFGRVVFSDDDPSLKFYSLSWKSEKIKKADSFASDFVSWYWLTDPFEDFAESFNMYINHNWVFRQMALESNILRQKYNFIAKIFKWNYINSDKNFDYKYWFRPWDSTIFSLIQQ